jgi:biotin transport system substrate-specific component
MTHTTPLVPRLISQTPIQSKALQEALTVVTGIALLAALSQISVRLPFTPVPITGQSLGVLLLSLTFGLKRSPWIVGSYLAVGLAGLPVFAVAPFGPTAGYLLGMLAASFAVGAMADRGWTSSFGRALTASLVGTAIIYAAGLAVLSYFVPGNLLLMAGLLPFLPGDLAKAVIAAGVASRMARSRA